MKAMNTIIKILTALAAVAGVVYIVATYGEQIVAWCKKTLASLPKCPSCEEAEAEVVEELAVEDPAEETAAEEVAEAEEPAPEVIVAENEPVAAEEDFAE